jgi:hypothetical protein
MHVGCLYDAPQTNLLQGKFAGQSQRELRGSGLDAKSARAAPHKDGTVSFIALATF